jgi:hypothetical protein
MLQVSVTQVVTGFLRGVCEFSVYPPSQCVGTKNAHIHV